MTRTLSALALALACPSLGVAQDDDAVVTQAELDVMRPRELSVAAYPIPLTTRSIAPPMPSGYSATLVDARTLLGGADPDPGDESYVLLSPSSPVERPAQPGPTRGLVGAWEFELHATGPLFNAAGGAAGGAVELESLGAETDAHGNIGAGLAFDGSDAVFLNQCAAGDASRDFSISAWFQTERNNGPLFLRGEQWSVAVDTNRIAARFGDGDSAMAPEKIADGRWHHVAVAWSAAEQSARVFINGRFGVQARSRTLPKPVEDDLAVGARLRYRFEGVLDDLRVWERALGDDELRSVWQASVVPDVVAWSVLSAPGAAHWSLDPLERSAVLNFAPRHPGGTLELLVWSGHPTGLMPYLRALRAAHGAQPGLFRVHRIPTPEGVELSQVGWRDERITMRSTRRDEWFLEELDGGARARWTRGDSNAPVTPMSSRDFGDARLLPESVRPAIDEDGQVAFARRNFVLRLDDPGWGSLSGALVRFAPTGQASRLLIDPDHPRRSAIVDLPLNVPGHVTGVQPIKGEPAFYAVTSNGFMRIDGTGQTCGCPVGWNAQENGVWLTFDTSLDRESALDSSSWAIELTGDINAKIAPERIELSDDGRRIYLELGPMRSRVKIRMAWSIRAADGRVLRNNLRGDLR